MNNKPTGVTILGVLAIIGGVLGLCAGLGGLMGGAFLAGSGLAGINTQTATATGLVFFYSIVALVIGVADIVVGVGFLQVKPWAWTLGVVLELASIVLAVFNIVAFQSIFGSIISIAIAGFILYYLFTPQVKAAFGRAA